MIKTRKAPLKALCHLWSSQWPVKMDRIQTPGPHLPYCSLWWPWWHNASGSRCLWLQNQFQHFTKIVSGYLGDNWQLCDRSRTFVTVKITFHWSGVHSRDLVTSKQGTWFFPTVNIDLTAGEQTHLWFYLNWVLLQRKLNWSFLWAPDKRFDSCWHVPQGPCSQWFLWSSHVPWKYIYLCSANASFSFRFTNMQVVWCKINSV